MATAFGNICPQPAGGAEDCLNLNIFTPSVNLLNSNPVMFWYVPHLGRAHVLGFMEGVLLMGREVIPCLMGLPLHVVALL